MKDNFIKGFLIGLFLPVIAFYFYTTLVLKAEISAGLKQLAQDNLLTQVIAINVIVNMLPLFVFNQRGETQALKGVVGASLLYALTISILYFF